MADPFDKPPKMLPSINPETGNIELTAEELGELLRWLERFQAYVETNLP